MLGIPGAGKSTVAQLLVQALAERTGRTPIVVGFDAIMHAIPAYRREKDIVAAFAKFEQPARQAGYCLIDELTARNADVLLDHGGAADSHPALLREAKERGYAVYAVHVGVDHAIAHERIAVRAAQEGRHTPPEYVDERSRKIDHLLPAYEELATGYFSVTNNSPEDLRRIEEREIPDITEAIGRRG